MIYAVHTTKGMNASSNDDPDWEIFIFQDISLSQVAIGSHITQCIPKESPLSRMLEAKRNRWHGEIQSRCGSVITKGTS